MEVEVTLKGSAAEMAGVLSSLDGADVEVKAAAPAKKKPAAKAKATTAAKKKGPGRPPKKEAEAAAEDDGDDFLDAEAEYSREDVIKALRDCAKANGSDAARKALQTAGGVKKVQELDESKFAAVIEAANG